MALTLVQYWQQERDVHEAAQTAAQTDLALAQSVMVAAKSALDARVKALEKLTADIATNRGKLATTPVGPPVTALNNTIRDQIVQQRTLQGAILDEQNAVSSAQIRADAATATLKRAAARLADSDAALSAAKDASKKRQLLASQLKAPPLDTIQADATALEASAAATDAKAQIDANFPAELQTIASKRHATRVARVAQLKKAVVDAEDALGTALAANNGLSGAAAKKGADFRHAEQALTEYAATAKLRYDRAASLFGDLQAIKNGTKKPDVLTPQEKLEAAANAARTTAETNAEPIDTARNALYTARQDLDTQVLTTIDADVDKLATDPNMKTKRDAIVAKAAALKNAQDALVASGDRAVLDAWEVVVQDSAWLTLIDYFDATAALAEIKTIAPATLAAKLVAAETAYGDALALAAKAQREADALTDVIAQRTGRVDASSAALQPRLLSAVRGDSF